MSSFACQVLGLVVEALESDRDLAARLRAALGGTVPVDELVPLRDCKCRASVRMLRTAISRGELAATKVGREFLVKHADVTAWVASHRVRAVAHGERVAPAPEKSPAERAIERARASGGLRVVAR